MSTQDQSDPRAAFEKLFAAHLETLEAGWGPIPLERMAVLVPLYRDQVKDDPDSVLVSDTRTEMVFHTTPQLDGDETHSTEATQDSQVEHQVALDHSDVGSSTDHRCAQADLPSLSASGNSLSAQRKPSRFSRFVAKGKSRLLRNAMKAQSSQTPYLTALSTGGSEPSPGGVSGDKVHVIIIEFAPDDAGTLTTEQGEEVRRLSSFTFRLAHGMGEWSVREDSTDAGERVQSFHMTRPGLAAYHEEEHPGKGSYDVSMELRDERGLKRRLPDDWLPMYFEEKLKMNKELQWYEDHRVGARSVLPPTDTAVIDFAGRAGSGAGSATADPTTTDAAARETPGPDTAIASTASDEGA